MPSRLLGPLKRHVIRKMKRSDVLFVSDTTLRDGEQMPGGTLFPREKVEIARHLERLGVHSIDAGFPACCGQEADSVRQVAGAVSDPIVTALCRATEADIDLAAEALRDKFLTKRGVSIFIGTSPQHREHKLGKTRAQILEMAVRSVEYACKSFAIVAFSPEDASRTELDFLVELYEAAIAAGATTVGFTDTLGCLTPDRAARCVTEIGERVGNIDRALFAIHFHNDLGMACANSLAAIRTGYVDIFQGTLLGIGERAGNASIEQVVVSARLLLNGEIPKKPQVNLSALKPACRLVAECMGLDIPAYQPVVGDNVFRTEAGIHQDGILKCPETYELYPPEEVGQSRQVVLGKHSGKHALQRVAAEHGIELDDTQLAELFRRFKKHFESAKSITVEQVLAMARKVRPEV